MFKIIEPVVIISYFVAVGFVAIYAQEQWEHGFFATWVIMVFVPAIAVVVQSIWKLAKFEVEIEQAEEQRIVDKLHNSFNDQRLEHTADSAGAIK